ncbi:N-acetylgalactosaminide alpha-2,6-sialyltransferase (sialyltransferase 7E) [Sarotherodon galilaeus]
MKTLVLLVASIALLVSLLTLTRKKEDEQHHLQTRWTHDNSHLRDMTHDHIHPWMNNAWYRYVYDSTPTKDCYICSHMPPTTQHATLYGKAMNMTQAKCAASYASLGYQYPGIVINHSKPLEIGLRNGTCDEWFWVDLKVKHRSKAGSFPVFLENNGNWSHSLCYRQENGSTPMGNTTNCKAVQTHAPGGPVDATSTSTSTTRKRRSTPDLKRHDSIWGSGVPEEFKLWTERQKVAHALFPWVGVGKHALRIETLNYRFGLFLNASCKINDEQDQEIDALRIAVMQHRVALDMILAEKGGLCVLFNNTHPT